jgi:hypothetical protein
MRPLLALTALAAGALIASQAQAYRVEEGGITAPEVAKVLQDKGYKAVVKTDEDGDPEVESAADGTDFVIFFYGCNHGPRCPSITFQTHFDTTHPTSVDDVNTWNMNKRFMKAWLNTDKTLYGEMDVDVSHGFLTEGLAEYVDVWSQFLPEFKSNFGY